MFFQGPPNRTYYKRACFALKSYGDQNLSTVTAGNIVYFMINQIKINVNLRVSPSTSKNSWYGTSGPSQVNT